MRCCKKEVNALTIITVVPEATSTHHVNDIKIFMSDLDANLFTCFTDHRVFDRLIELKMSVRWSPTSIRIAGVGSS